MDEGSMVSGRKNGGVERGLVQNKHLLRYCEDIDDDDDADFIDGFHLFFAEEDGCFIAISYKYLNK